jgi:hypothetical protein
MIIIVLLILFSYYLFWQFEHKRKLKNMEHRRERQEAFYNLLEVLQKTKDETTDKNKL